MAAPIQDLLKRKFISHRHGILWLFCFLLTTGAVYADEYGELFRQAASFAQQGQYEKAVGKYKAALQIRPGAPEALNNLAAMYYAARRFELAFETASPIWKQHPGLTSAALVTGLAAVQISRPREAIAPLESVIARAPANRDALLGLASAHLALGNLTAAAEIYERETARDASDSLAWYGEGICYERMAEQASRKLAKMPEGESFSKRLLAEYLQGQGDAKLAQEAFGQSKNLNQGDSPAAQAKYDEARRLAEKSKNAFEHVVKLSPDSWQAAVFLGDVERQQGHLVQALARYKTAAELTPDNPAPLIGLGTTYWELGEFEKAKGYLRDVLKINPNTLQATFELGNIAVREHREAEAIPLLKAYLARQPDAAAAHADLGRAYFHLKRYGEAEGELEKGARSDEQGDVHYQLSISLRKLGRIGEAQKALAASNAIREARSQRQRTLQSDH